MGRLTIQVLFLSLALVVRRGVGCERYGGVERERERNGVVVEKCVGELEILQLSAGVYVGWERKSSPEEDGGDRKMVKGGAEGADGCGTSTI